MLVANVLLAFPACFAATPHGLWLGPALLAASMYAVARLRARRPARPSVTTPAYAPMPAE